MKPTLGHLNDRYDRSLVEPIVQNDSNGQYKPVNRKTVQYKAPHGQFRVKSNQNCPKEQISWTFLKQSKPKLSNRLAFMDKTEIKTNETI